MIHSSEHRAPWENSEDKSEHISSVSFILCTFAAHIHRCLHPLNNKRKQECSIAWFVILSDIISLFLSWRGTSLTFPQVFEMLFVLPTHWYCPSLHGNRRQSFYFLKFRMQNLPTPAQGVKGRDRREQDDRGIWSEQSFIPQTDLAKAYKQSAFPQRPPCPLTNQGMKSNRTNIDFPTGINFSKHKWSIISNQQSNCSSSLHLKTL